MSRQASPTLIGAFVLGALILGTIAILLLAGGHWFQERRQHIMYFRVVGQGLQVGAPVVFLGVKVGTVKEIQLGMDEENRRMLVPVTVELEPHTVRTGRGEVINLQEKNTIRDLVKRGLRARLNTQSLLTGQLYVDLDFYPDKPARFFSNDPQASEIPTIPTTIEKLITLLEDFPIEEFLANLAAISSATNKIVSTEAMHNIPLRLEATLANLQSLTARFDAAGDPLLIETKKDLIELHKALDAVQAAMGKIGDAADRIAEFADTDAKLYGNVTQAGEELANAARNLRLLADEKSPTLEHLNDALQEITRAARALRLLADTLERQPEAVIRGKDSEEDK